MLMVSKITVHPKKGQTYLIELVRQHSEEVVTELEVHEDLIVKYQIRKGMPVSDQQMQKLDQENQTHHVYQSALNYISYRMRSKKEVHDFLKNKEFPESLIQEAIEKLKENQFLDDQAFGDAFVRSRIRLSNKGPTVIKNELIQKGLTEEQIDSSLAQYSEEAQYELALALAQKKKDSWQGRSQQDIQQKLRQLLMQKGFSSRLINQVLADLVEEKDESEEWFAIKKQGDKVVHKYHTLSGYEKKMKIKQFLYRKGFQSDLIEQWFNQYDEESE